MKVLFTFYDQKGEKSEELDVIPVKENIFRIIQIPTKALGISKDDEVEALTIGDENLPEFIRFIKKSGNSTISINKFPNDQTKTKVLQKLEKEFCELVEYDNKMNVNILQIADLDEIQNFLLAHETSFEVMNPNPYDGKLIIPF